MPLYSSFAVTGEADPFANDNYVCFHLHYNILTLSFCFAGSMQHRSEVYLSISHMLLRSALVVLNPMVPRYIKTPVLLETVRADP